MRILDAAQVERLRIKAIKSGATASGPQSAFWDIAGGCQNDTVVDLTGRESPEWRVISAYDETLCFPASKISKYVEGDKTQLLSLKVRCGHCPACIYARAARWAHRASCEHDLVAHQGKHTWFGTITIDEPSYRAFLAESLVRNENAEEEALLVHRSAGRALQRWFKRMRKHGYAFRYFLVFEKGGTTGRAHYHFLMHETGAPIVRRVFTGAPAFHRDFSKFEHTKWPHGEVRRMRHIKGDPWEAAWYVAKYVAKSRDARVRASIGYGKRVEGETQVQEEIPF